ncbi:phosphopantetheine-binding protein [Dactylosporangium darangshiense]|uniref:Carrier domain-containing protein n=1 Tax=Dactylosporangium darangshiense TaxID=579108 RepID=A0ABP8DP61_9ACTN
MTAQPDDLEATVAHMWTELGLRPSDPADDFFVLGGQSLTLVKFLTMVQRDLGVEVPIEALFSTDLTVAAAAGAIRQGQAPAADEDVAAALAELDKLSDEEIAALLAEPVD